MATGVWDGIVRTARNATFLLERGYIGYHAHRFDEKSVVVMRGNEPVAIFPCTYHDGEIVSHGGLTYGGLIFGDHLRAAEVLQVFELLGAHYRAAGARTIIYKVIPHIFHRYPAEEDLYALFRMGATLVRRDLSTALPLAGRLKPSELRRRAARKAEKQQIEMREGNFFADYHDLLVKALSKFDTAPVHSVEELHLLAGRFPGRIRLFGAWQGERLLAGTLVYDFGHAVHTQYLGNSEEGRAVGALDILILKLIEEVFTDRSYFSFGISTEKGGTHLNEGLVFQKESFGGRAIVHDFYLWRL